MLDKHSYSRFWQEMRLQPRAIAVLPVFIASTLAMLEQQAIAKAGQTRRAMLGMGSVYSSGVFTTYLVLGFELLSAASFFSRTYVVSRFCRPRGDSPRPPAAERSSAAGAGSTAHGSR